MSHSPYARAAGRGCGLAALQLALIPVALVLVLGLPLAVAAIAPVSDAVRLVIAGAGIFVMMSALAIGALGFAAVRTRALDPGFAPLGIRGGGWMPNLREYHGAIGGRALDALYARRGGVLDLALDARTATKVAIGGSAVTRVARETLGLATLPPRADLPDAVVAADDPAWAGALLADPLARDAIAYLLRDPNGRELRWVMVRPGCVKVTRRWIDPEAAIGTISDHTRALAQLASACERLGAPARVIAPGWLETTFRRRPTGAGLAIALGILAVVAVPAVICVVLALLLSSA